MKVGCILSAQGISALTARMPFGGRAAHLLNNCCTKVFLSTDCPETLHYFEGIVPAGTAGKSECPSAPDRTVSPFRLPNYEFASAESEPKNPTSAPLLPIRGGDLRCLDVGEGIVVRPRGVVERVQFPAFANP